MRKMGVLIATVIAGVTVGAVPASAYPPGDTTPTTAVAGGGGSLPATLAANWLAASWDQNAAMVVSSPTAARLEQVTLGWLRDVLALPRARHGVRGLARSRGGDE